MINAEILYPEAYYSNGADAQECHHAGLQSKLLADTIFSKDQPLLHHFFGYINTCRTVESAAVSYVVSLHNRCRFCADLHEATLYELRMRGAAAAIREQHFASIANPRLRQSVLWAYAGIVQPEGEWIQAAQQAHFANRVANAMGWQPASRFTPRRIRKWMARRVAQRPFVPLEATRQTPPLLSGEVERRIRTHLRAWHGEEPGPNRGWVENYLADLTPSERAAARLALLTAMASHQVDAFVRGAFRDGYGDSAMEALIEWAAGLGSRRVMDVTSQRVVHAAA